MRNFNMDIDVFLVLTNRNIDNQGTPRERWNCL